MKLEELQRIENTQQPTAGMGLALDTNGFVTPAVVALRPAHATCSSNTTITATASPGTDITGATLTLAEVGSYLVWGVFDFTHTAAGAADAVGELSVGGTVSIGVATLNQAASRGTTTQVWLVTTTAANSVAKLAGWKTAAGGTLVASSPHTTITVLRVG